MSFARLTRRAGAFIAGTVLMLAGFVLLFIPGPGTVVMLAGLGVMATEFVWARRLFDRIKDRVRQALPSSKRTQRPESSESDPPPPP